MVSGGQMIFAVEERGEDSFKMGSLPCSRIKIVFTDDIDSPIIKFKWRGRYGNFHWWDALEDFVIYGLIICKPSDWGIGIGNPGGNRNIRRNETPRIDSEPVSSSATIRQKKEPDNTDDTNEPDESLNRTDFKWDFMEEKFDKLNVHIKSK
jgi:hypothetical protein